MSETPKVLEVEPDNIDPTPQAGGLHPHGSSLVCYQDSPHESVRDQRFPERQADCIHAWGVSHPAEDLSMDLTNLSVTVTALLAFLLALPDLTIVIGPIGVCTAITQPV